MKRDIVSREELAEIITQTIRQHRRGGKNLPVTTAKILHFQETEPDGSNWSCPMARPSEEVSLEAIQEIWSDVMPTLRRKYNVTTTTDRTRGRT